jgi:hypothetical protein
VPRFASQIHITSFSLEQNYDYLYFYDADYVTYSPFITWSGTEAYTPLSLPGAYALTARMTTDSSLVREGFVAYFLSTPVCPGTHEYDGLMRMEVRSNHCGDLVSREESECAARAPVWDVICSGCLARQEACLFGPCDVGDTTAGTRATLQCLTGWVCVPLPPFPPPACTCPLHLAPLPAGHQ